jgi:8-oxo-dGTP pyrophosphatase MutT (NUDIX family)
MVRRGLWFIQKPKTFGAHAIAITPEGKVVLVKLRYAPGWHVPGGGRRQSEDPIEAAFRELREEIGMISHGDARPASDFDEIVDFKRDTASLVVVRDVRYRPRWTLEVEQVREANVDALPAELAEPSRRWIEAVRPLL